MLAFLRHQIVRFDNTLKDHLVVAEMGFVNWFVRWVFLMPPNLFVPFHYLGRLEGRYDTTGELPQSHLFLHVTSLLKEFGPLTV